MTLDESASLTPEQLRVAVAERLGWDGFIQDDDDLYGLPPGSPTIGVVLNEVVPDYPESRDACATFEATLTGKQRAKYVYLLREIHGARVGDLDSLIAANEELAFSDGTQRCRTFLAVTENRNE